MVETGLAEAGYTYINIDDCWHGKRDKDGFIQADPKRFSSGIKSLDWKSRESRFRAQLLR